MLDMSSVSHVSHSSCSVLLFDITFFPSEHIFSYIMMDCISYSSHISFVLQRLSSINLHTSCSSSLCNRLWALLTKEIQTFTEIHQNPIQVYFLLMLPTNVSATPIIVIMTTKISNCLYNISILEENGTNFQI